MYLLIGLRKYHKFLCERMECFENIYLLTVLRICIIAANIGSEMGTLCLWQNKGPIIYDTACTHDTEKNNPPAPVIELFQKLRSEKNINFLVHIYLKYIITKSSIVPYFNRHTWGTKFELSIVQSTDFFHWLSYVYVIDSMNRQTLIKIVRLQHPDKISRKICLQCIFDSFLACKIFVFTLVAGEVQLHID